MKATCPVCDKVNEVRYYIKRETSTLVLNMTLNVKCFECGSIFPMTENTTPTKESTNIHKVKDARDNANYIG